MNRSVKERSVICIVFQVIVFWKTKGNLKNFIIQRKDYEVRFQSH